MLRAETVTLKVDLVTCSSARSAMIYSRWPRLVGVGGWQVKLKCTITDLSSKQVASARRSQKRRGRSEPSQVSVVICHISVVIHPTRISPQLLLFQRSFVHKLLVFFFITLIFIFSVVYVFVVLHVCVHHFFIFVLCHSRWMLDGFVVRNLHYFRLCS